MIHKPVSPLLQTCAVEWVIVLLSADVILVSNIHNNDCDIHCRSCHFWIGLFFKIVKEVSESLWLWLVGREQLKNYQENKRTTHIYCFQQ